MADFYNQKLRLTELSNQLKTAEDAFNVQKLQGELSVLREKQSEEGYWLNVERSGKDNREIAAIEKKLSALSGAREEIEFIKELIELSESEEDEGEDVVPLMDSAEEKISQLFMQSLLRGKYDNLNAILTLHAGAGGTEAQDWAEMLYRMYSRYAENAGFKQSVLDYQDGDEAGLKSVTFLVSGEQAYGFLKAEMGVHRLVRISPFDSNKRRHTSFASLEVMPEIIENDEIKINSDDLRIDTLRSSGAGGQHVNKTESAIRITHLPTGIVVQCQNERSQLQNRETAMKMLIGKLTERKERENLEKAQSIKGTLKKIEWGSQIRSYVFCPYTLVKDHRTGFENTNITAVMDGDIAGFIYEYLKQS